MQGLVERISSPNRLVGSWVQARSNGLGYARCVDVSHGEAILEYTDIPGSAVKALAVATDDLVVPRIPRGARVWLRGIPYGWHCAEITGWGGLGTYFVRVPAMPRELEVGSDNFVHRWNQPLGDPPAAVIEGLCDSPEYYEARRAFLDELLRQRRVSRGFAGILSAPIELFQHQLDTVARVLSDPVLRFLLADEVGLGKTIEAGVVVRQLLLDDPGATALIAVPSTLVSQWREELHDRLLLANFLAQGRLRLVSHGDLILEPTLHRHAVVVVDEAHSMLPILDQVPGLRADLWRTAGLLLLSATPMRGDAAAFLNLLNLVDPVAFPRDDPAAFEKRLAQRERDATDLQVLTSRRASDRQRGVVLDNLLGSHGTDPSVARMVAECRLVSASSPVTADLVQYVRETYQISRRMIRNRRETPATQQYPVTGRRAVFVPFTDPARGIVDDFLDRYRDFHESPDRTSFAYAVMHGLGGPRALLRFLERRLSASPAQARTDERSLFAETAARLRLTDTNTRLFRAAEIVQERLDRGLKVVVFANTAAVASEFYAHARERWPECSGRHLDNGEQQSARDEDVFDFLSRRGGGVLVGDHTLEEGRNLQGAQVLINLDLPLDPNRLEQRIGRLDRFARQADPAEVVVLAEPTSQWVTAHLSLLDDGIGIFTRSVATLQRKLAEIFDGILGNLQGEGSSAFALNFSAIQADIAEELTEVDLLEEIESVAATSDFDDLAVADLRDADGDVTSLRAAFTRLTSARGGIGLRPVEDTVRSVLTFNVDGTSLFGLAEDTAAQIRPLLSQRLTYARSASTSRVGIAPLRIGNPLVDWLDRYLRLDERGRARAIVRSAEVPYPAMWFGCDFMIEFDAAGLADQPDTARRRLRRRGDVHLPPAMVRTWTNAVGPASESLVKGVLEASFDANRDQVLRGPVWRQVLDAIPDWRHLCRVSSDAAWDHLRSTPQMSAAPQIGSRRALEETQARLAVLRARSLRLPTEAERISAGQELEREEVLGAALVRGVEHPAVTTIACAAIVLWPAAP